MIFGTPFVNDNPNAQRHKHSWEKKTKKKKTKKKRPKSHTFVLIVRLILQFDSPSFFYQPTITDVKQMFFAKTTVVAIATFVVIATFLAITMALLIANSLAFTKNIILNLSENNFCHAENDT